jgi:predicted ribosomally synthesized peptide with SipW-like signal peptide
MKKNRILYSLLIIGVVGAAVFGATQAFFTDSETSTGNTFQAGAIDLKVDSECHYYQYDPENVDAFSESNGDPEYLWGYVDARCPEGVGDWDETDLTQEQFFAFEDLKPGDRGEDTISLHVYDNDAWGRFIISNVTDLDNDCTEPESESNDQECNVAPSPTPDPPGDPGSGELRENMVFWAWLDQGSTPGFQCSPDPGQPGVAECVGDPQEGDNVWQDNTEPVLIQPGQVDADEEIHNIWEGLQLAYQQGSCTGDGTLEGPDCPGLAPDGRMIGSITYFFGLAWMLPEDVGNEVQTDSLTADMTFEVMQHRNAPTPFPTL